MTAESPRPWWRDYWDAFTRSGAYDPATRAYRARMERLADRWERRAERYRRLADGRRDVVAEQLTREADVWVDAARDLRRDLAHL